MTLPDESEQHLLQSAVGGATLPGGREIGQTLRRTALVAQAVTERFSVLMTCGQTRTAIRAALRSAAVSEKTLALLHGPHRLKRSQFALVISASTSHAVGMEEAATNEPLTSRPQAAQRLAASAQPPHEVRPRLLVGVVGHLWEH